MGKKRKQEEISDDERIQTVLVRQPFGWNDPSVWDAEDRKRNDNGLYVLVEWLTFVFGGAGGPGMLQNLRRLGYVVEDVWWWSSRNEILVSIHPDININTQLGPHYLSLFLTNPPAGTGTNHTLLSKARYEGAVQIVGKGEGWKLVPKVPIIQPTSIRTRKFVIPYPTPGHYDPSLPTAEPSDRKPTIKPEPDVKVKTEQSSDTKPRVETEENRSFSVQTADVKPSLPSVNVKPEAREGSSVPTGVKAEPETQEPLAQVKEEMDSKASLADELAAQRAHQRLLELDEKDADANAATRPTKRVKVEQ